MTTPIPQIVLAVEGLFDYHIKTNPFGEKKPKNEVAEAKRKEAIKRQNLKLDLMQMKARQANKARLKEDG